MYLIEDEIIGIKKISDEYKQSYYNMAKSRSILKNNYDKLFTEIWREIQDEELLIFVAEIKSSNEICAFCQLDNTNARTPEFGLDVLDEYMGKGYGKKTAKLVLEYASSFMDVDYFVWKADKNNIKSQKIAEDIGGILMQEKPLLTERVIEFGKNENILSDEDLTIVKKYKINSVTKFQQQ